MCMCGVVFYPLVGLYVFVVAGVCFLVHVFSPADLGERGDGADLEKGGAYSCLDQAAFTMAAGRRHPLSFSSPIAAPPCER
jgi:hypothetical protein